MTVTSALQLSNPQVLVQAVGRLLYQLSFGVMNFYIPILFVNRMGFSATSVGFALGLVSITEVGGHLIGGTLADSAKFGRKTVLALAGGLGIVVSILLILAHSLWMVMLANLVLGVSLGFYWTASGAAVMDATDSEERPKAFAVLGLMEYIGIGIGILGGSALLGLLDEAPQFLFGGCYFAATGTDPSRQAFVKSVLDDSYDGAVKLAEDELTFRLLHGPPLGGEAINTLMILLADVTAMIARVDGIGHMPALLVHDSPREADLGQHIYWNLLRLAADLATRLSTDNNAAFQYIVTTTTSPPPDMRNDAFVVLPLDASDPDKLLFQEILRPSEQTLSD